MSLYKQRIEDGLCGSCGAENPGGSICPVCKEKQRLRAAATRAKNKETGCLGCGVPTTGGSRCESCKAAAKVSRQKSYKQRKQDGICTACGEPAKPGCACCQACIDVRSAAGSKAYFERKAAGTCRYCGNPPDEAGGGMCSYHKAKYLDYRFKAKVETIDAYGGPVCAGCGCDDIEVLSIDHIAQDGAEHRRKLDVAGSGQFYNWLKKNGYPAGYRVLCFNCNWKAYRQATKAGCV